MVPETAAAGEEPRDAPESQPVARLFRSYGSLRARLLYSSAGLKLDGQTSRVEVGFNLRDVSAALIGGGDPGSSNAAESSLMELRLFLVGLEHAKGELSFGKQWSAYYDVAVFTDQLPFLAGAGTAVYNAGTDGGVSGTGRAEQAL